MKKMGRLFLSNSKNETTYADISAYLAKMGVKTVPA